jgi:hypothetical protein
MVRGPGAPEDVDARLVTALRQRGVEVGATVAAGLRQASDEEQLAYAARRQRVLVAYHIRRSSRVCATWMQARQAHWGIITLMGQAAVGTWLRRMERLLQRFLVEEYTWSIPFANSLRTTP